MVYKTTVLWLALLLSLYFGHTQMSADQGHGKHPHDEEKTPHGKTAEDRDHLQERPHQHPWWESPPAAYANVRSDRWDDAAAVARGKQLYQTYCTMCHGTDGKGTGPAAKSLAHPPADLSHHFHRAPGDGDAYLFWRVSEGGQVEPFTSSQLAMPAFQTVLSADQRWDVLAYVHATFHKGFLLASATTLPSAVTGEGTVIAVVPSNHQLIVQHGEITGFMGAMIMGYTVIPPSLLDGFKTGDHIRFTIDTQKQAIIKIEEIKS